MQDNGRVVVDDKYLIGSDNTAVSAIIDADGRKIHIPAADTDSDKINAVGRLHNLVEITANNFSSHNLPR